MAELGDNQRAFIDHQQHRERAVRLRGEILRPLVGSGVSRITPSRKTLRTFLVACLLATGAFWTVMLNAPPTSDAGGPSVIGLTPSTLPVPVGLETGGYDAH